MQRLLRIAVIGLPNAGKSTLINQLTNHEVCPVSQRVHTTRKSQRAIFLEQDTQLVFVDTPGLVNKKEIKKFQFNHEFTSDPENSVKSADLIAVLHDLSNAVTRNKIDQRIVKLLQNFEDKNSILIINKVDLLRSKRKLLDTVRYLTSGYVGGSPIALKDSIKREKPINKFELFERSKQQISNAEPDAQLRPHKPLPPNTVLFTPQEIKDGMDKIGWPHFQDVFMISALEGNGVDLLKDYFVVNAKPAEWMFKEDVLTDVSPIELAVKIVQSKLLDNLPAEMPYKLDPKLEYWEKDDNTGEVQIIIGIKSPNSRITKRLIGHGGSNILKITDETEKVLTNLLHTTVNVRINVIEDEKTASQINNMS